MALILIKFFGIFILFDLIFSLILSFSSNKLFEFHKKNKKDGYIPFYNLFILINIVQLNKYYFLLLFVPVVNLFVILYILYRLSIMHELDFIYTIGLIFLPIVFLPILNYKLIVLKTVEYVRDKNDINLMSDEELENIETNSDNKIDNVFKAEIKQKEVAPTFKANSIKYKNMMFDDDQMEVLKRIEPIKVNNINKQNTESKTEDNSIEIVEL